MYRGPKTAFSDSAQELFQGLEIKEFASDDTIPMELEHLFPLKNNAGVLLGEDSAFQADGEGSNPFSRSKSDLVLAK